ncbi:MAG TPA: bifunctional hydroxymethylpyrimidine kinase/phosphomethylpyrimidine kinase [Hyphomicrobiaceae bacterium]|jgi:hydroxymethylpyrimidine/phosphomethylpyrimidine kinase|nr:bifunctional hydroxymethylpyrimidine kinase/phosphomethylpyrimidine kinase [Hyphomicrobiaceae bacterium]
MRQSPGRTAIALTIAGSDSSGGAGIQADLKTFTALGVYGASVITALTAQNTRGVEGVEAIRPEFVLAQLNSVLSDLDVGAVKTGMLANGAIVTTVARRLREVTGSGRPLPLIVDPVMVATSGDALLEADAIDAIRQELAPLATLLTPNLAEAARLLGAEPADSETAAAAQAKALFARLGCPILLKGGHASGSEAVDLYFAGSELVRLSRPRLDTPHSHGSGCVLSAAVAALQARGLGLQAAIAGAKAFVWQGLAAGASLGVGQGRGPVDCLFGIRRTSLPIENYDPEQ